MQLHPTRLAKRGHVPRLLVDHLAHFAPAVALATFAAAVPLDRVRPSLAAVLVSIAEVDEQRLQAVRDRVVACEDVEEARAVRAGISSARVPSAVGCSGAGKQAGMRRGSPARPQRKAGAEPAAAHGHEKGEWRAQEQQRREAASQLRQRLKSRVSRRGAAGARRLVAAAVEGAGQVVANRRCGDCWCYRGSRRRWPWRHDAADAVLRESCCLSF